MEFWIWFPTCSALSFRVKLQKLLQIDVTVLCIQYICFTFSEKFFQGRMTKTEKDLDTHDSSYEMASSIIVTSKC